MAAAFYTDLMNLKTHKQVIAAQLDKLKSVRESLNEKLRGLPEKGMQLARIKARQQSLEAAEALLASRQREAQLYEETALPYYRFYEAKMDEVETSGRTKKVAMLVVADGIFGALLAAMLIGILESMDDRIKTVADLKRVTEMPLLATLPNLATMDAVAQAGWGFRTWLALQAKLVVGLRREMVCGVLASSTGEGCSTWVELLGRGAAQRDDVVLVVINRAPPNGTTTPLAQALKDPAGVALERGRTNWLVADSDWRWDAAARRQWQSALGIWQRTAGLVVLAELTAADQTDTLLMAELFPQLIWLARNGVARSRATGERLQPLRHAGCRFVGTVLNGETKLFPWL